MEEPSVEWTEKERLGVTLAIGLRLSEMAKTQAQHDWRKVRDFGDRLQYLANAKSEFLEDNRPEILYGLDHELRQLQEFFGE